MTLLSAATRAAGRPTLKGVLRHGIGRFLIGFPGFLLIVLIPLALNTAERIAYGQVAGPGWFRHIVEAIWVLARVPVWTLFGVAWLRHLLYGTPARRLWLPSWTRRHWRFALCAFVAIGLPTYLVPRLSFYGIEALWPGAYGELRDYRKVAELGLMIFIPGCFALAFCAIVTESGRNVFRDLRNIWRTAAGTSLTMLLGLLPVTWGMFEVSEFLLRVLTLYGSSTLTQWIVRPLLLTSFGYLFFGLMMTAWAYAYQRITGWEGPQDHILERFE